MEEELQEQKCLKMVALPKLSQHVRELIKTKNTLHSLWDSSVGRRESFPDGWSSRQLNWSLFLLGSLAGLNFHIPELIWRSSLSSLYYLFTPKEDVPSEFGQFRGLLEGIFSWLLPVLKRLSTVFNHTLAYPIVLPPSKHPV